MGGAVAAGLLALTGPWWAAPIAAGIVAIALTRRPSGRSRKRREADRRLVAIHAELLAACLDSGMAVAAALRAVSEVMADGGRPPELAGLPPEGAAEGFGVSRRADDGPMAVLDSVAAMLALGAAPGTAWRLADLDPDLAPLAAAARRSASGGAGLSQAVREHAAQLRQETAAVSLRAAGRAGVLMTAPLGICFLPAFLCLGLAPVVIGLLGQLHIF